uniref:Uncharacterized protein n=1 Tax=Anguilla anguilla TaxID=7936 RepID=A0A0E9VIV7_ANGAN
METSITKDSGGLLGVEPVGGLLPPPC